MKTIKVLVIFLYIIFSSALKAENIEFSKWLKSFKTVAIQNNISVNTFDKVMSNVKYLPKVIEYDRYQPEHYEDTKTYIEKRTSQNKVKKGASLYKKNYNLINSIDKNFAVEKELLLSLMGIETNFGTYVGKMDIISSLATLSYDKRRSEFFTNELITILKLIDDETIDYKILYGSWAGAFGNFQFMPSTIKGYALDYNLNNRIELKSIEDSFASAANYLNKIGWKKNEPCFQKIILTNDIPLHFLNTSAKKINNKKKISYFKKYINNYDDFDYDENLLVGIITPDKDIVENANQYSPAYLTFHNFDLILKWNRSLRFAIAVCSLKNKFANAL
jgi:membrane-bound lytic murein transglycosylase B